MSISPQPMYDGHGNKIGVFLSIQDWQAVEKNISLEIIPEWEQRLALQGLNGYRRNPEAVIDWESIKADIEKEDGKI